MTARRLRQMDLGLLQMDSELLLAQNPWKMQAPSRLYQIQTIDQLLRMDSALSLVRNLLRVPTPPSPPRILMIVQLLQMDSALLLVPTTIALPQTVTDLELPPLRVQSRYRHRHHWQNERTMSPKMNSYC
jgi:hypothetical protein